MLACLMVVQMRQELGRVPACAVLMNSSIRLINASVCGRRYDVNVTPDKRKVMLHGEKAILDTLKEVGGCIMLTSVLFIMLTSVHL